MATHSSILAWRILWIEEPGGLQVTGLQRVRHNCVTNSNLLTCLEEEKNGSRKCFFPGKKKKKKKRHTKKNHHCSLAGPFQIWIPLRNSMHLPCIHKEDYSECKLECQGWQKRKTKITDVHCNILERSYHQPWKLMLSMMMSF